MIIFAGVATQQTARPLEARGSNTRPPDITFLNHISANQSTSERPSPRSPSVIKIESGLNASKPKQRTPAIVRPFESTPYEPPVTNLTPGRVSPGVAVATDRSVTAAGSTPSISVSHGVASGHGTIGSKTTSVIHNNLNNNVNVNSTSDISLLVTNGRQTIAPQTVDAVDVVRSVPVSLPPSDPLPDAKPKMNRVWQPMKLESSPPDVSERIIPPHSREPPSGPDKRTSPPRSRALSATPSMPTGPVLQLDSHTESEVSRPPVPIPLPSPPSPKMSRLDVEEKRLKELCASGLEMSEAQEMLLDEAAATSTSGLLSITASPVPLDTSCEVRLNLFYFLCLFKKLN